MCLVPAIGSIIKPMICTHGSIVCCLVWGTIKKGSHLYGLPLLIKSTANLANMISSFQNVPENQFQKDIFGYWENLMSGQ